MIYRFPSGSGISCVISLVIGVLCCVSPACSAPIQITYTYTDGRLTIAGYNGTNTVSYAYDANGNVVQRVVGIAAPLAFVTNAPVPVPEWWFASYGISGNLAAANTNDLDGDNVLTWREYVMDTDPINAQSKLTLVALRPYGTVPAAGNLLSWEASPNRFYAILWQTNLSLGITNILVENLRPVGYGPMTYTDVVHRVVPGVFYRIRVDLP